MKIIKTAIINTIYTLQELYLFSFSFSAKAILASFTSSIVSVYLSINLSTNFFLHLQFSFSKYSLKSQFLSHSHSQLLGFQINPLSQIPLSTDSLHSHLQLFLFHRCLLLETISSNLHLHLYFSCHFINLVSLVLDIRLNTLTFKFFIISGTQIFAYGLLILLQLPLHLFILILKG